AGTDGGGRRERAVHLARGRAPSASCLSVALDPGLAGVHRERGRRGDGPELLAAAQPALRGRAAPPVAAGGTGGRTLRHAGRRGGAFAPTPGALSGRRVGFGPLAFLDAQAGGGCFFRRAVQAGAAAVRESHSVLAGRPG